jgi:DNA-directed RNA polymerase specialized sigma24 family protein
MHAKFINIYDQTVDDIFAYCLKQTRNKDIAKIVTKEVYAKAWDAMNESLSSRQIKTMIYTIAANAIKESTTEKGIASRYFPTLNLI